MEIGHADAAGKAGDFRPVPRNREGDRRRAENAEVISIVRVLPDVFAREDQVLAKRLLKADVEFVTPARCQWCRILRRATKQRVQDRGVTSDAGQHETFVEWSFEHARI